MKTIFSLPLAGELLAVGSVVCAGYLAATCNSFFADIERIRHAEAADVRQVEQWQSQRYQAIEETAVTPVVADEPVLKTSNDAS